MIVWHEVYPGLIEGHVGGGDVILARVWYDTPLFFNKHKATWRARTTFGGVNIRSYGGAYPTMEAAQAAMEDYLGRVAKVILEES